MIWPVYVQHLQETSPLSATISMVGFASQRKSTDPSRKLPLMRRVCRDKKSLYSKGTVPVIRLLVTSIDINQGGLGPNVGMAVSSLQHASRLSSFSIPAMGGSSPDRLISSSPRIRNFVSCSTLGDSAPFRSFPPRCSVSRCRSSKTSSGIPPPPLLTELISRFLARERCVTHPSSLHFPTPTVRVPLRGAFH